MEAVIGQSLRLCRCGLEPMRGSDMCWCCVRTSFEKGPEPRRIPPGRWRDVPATAAVVQDMALQIKLSVCAEFAIPMSLLTANRGGSRLALRARSKAARRLRNEMRLTPAEIADVLGGGSEKRVLNLLSRHHEVSHKAAK